MSHEGCIEVSVIIPAYRDWEVLPRCLESLQRQTGDVSFEIIVVVSGADGTEATLRRRFPDVRILAFTERKFIGAARNIGAKHARGGIFLFMDADCTLAPEGLARTFEIHRRYPNPLVGCAFGNGASNDYPSWGYYFSSLAPWMPRQDLEPMAISDVAGGGMSIKRWAFERYGPFWDEPFAEDTILSWRIARAGLSPLLDPGLRLEHCGTVTLGQLLRRKFSYGRAYAALRAREEHWSGARRWLHIAGTPVIPGLLMYRMARQVFRARCYRGYFLLALPVTFLAVASWTAGEFVGLLGAEGSDGPAPSQQEASS